jgi:hypothetical protein
MNTPRFTVIALLPVLLIVLFWKLAVPSPEEHREATVVFGVT